MADIKKELNDIKTAIYGRDVRGAIHDGIDKINKESEVSKQKADEAHDVMESIINDGFDNAALEANFEQKLDDKIGQLQPEWTQFKNDTEQNFNSVTSQLNEIMIDISKFGEFGLVNDNDNFISACEYASSMGGTLLIKDKTINLDGVIIPNLPSIKSVNSIINVDGDCAFTSTNNGLTLVGLDIVAITPAENNLLSIIGVKDVIIDDLSFEYKTILPNRFSEVIRFTDCVNIRINNPIIEGVNIGISFRDYGMNAITSGIVINNPTFKNFKTGLYVTANNTPLNEDNYIKNIVINNIYGVNTEEQSNVYDGTKEGANLIMCERVSNIEIYNMYGEFTIERLGYFNMIKNLVIDGVTIKNGEGLKVCGTPNTSSEDFEIKNVTMVNRKKGGYVFRSYFTKNGIVENLTMDNQQMIIKPENVISLSGRNENIKIRNIDVTGLHGSILVNRIDDFGGSFGYAFVDYIPLLKDFVMEDCKYKDVCLKDVSHPLLQFIWSLSVNNPSPSGTIDDKIILDGFKIDNVDFLPRVNYVGTLGRFKHTNNLDIKSNLYNFKNNHFNIINYDDVITENNIKNLQINVYVDGNFPIISSSYNNIFLNVTEKSYFEFHYLNKKHYKIYKNNQYKLSTLNINDEVFTMFESDNDFSLVTYLVLEGETFSINYSDGELQGNVEINNSVLAVNSSNPIFSDVNMEGNIVVTLSPSNYVTIKNRTGKIRIANIKVTKIF